MFVWVAMWLLTDDCLVEALLFLACGFCIGWVDEDCSEWVDVDFPILLLDLQGGWFANIS